MEALELLKMKDAYRFSGDRTQLKFGGIYKIRFLNSPDENDFYIGKTIKFSLRFLYYSRCFRENIEISKKFTKAIQKYGTKLIQFSIVEVLTDEREMYTKENEYIAKLRPNINYLLNSKFNSDFILERIEKRKKPPKTVRTYYNGNNYARCMDMSHEFNLSFNSTINLMIDFYFEAQNTAKANRNMTAEQLVNNFLK